MSWKPLKTIGAGFAFLLFVAAPSFAYQWVTFEPCGFNMPDTEEMIPDTMRAPHYRTMYIHRAHIIGMFQVDARLGQKGPACSVLVLSNGITRPVIGTIEEVVNKIRGLQ